MTTWRRIGIVAYPDSGFSRCCCLQLEGLVQPSTAAFVTGDATGAGIFFLMALHTSIHGGHLRCLQYVHLRNIAVAVCTLLRCVQMCSMTPENERGDRIDANPWNRPFGLGEPGKFLYGGFCSSNRLVACHAKRAVREGHAFAGVWIAMADGTLDVLSGMCFVAKWDRLRNWSGRSLSFRVFFEMRWRRFLCCNTEHQQKRHASCKRSGSDVFSGQPKTQASHIVAHALSFPSR